MTSTTYFNKHVSAIFKAEQACEFEGDVTITVNTGEHWTCEGLRITFSPDGDAMLKGTFNGERGELFAETITIISGEAV